MYIIWSRLYSELVTGSRKDEVASRERNKVATYAQKGGESALLKPPMTQQLKLLLNKTHCFMSAKIIKWGTQEEWEYEKESSSQN